MKWRIISILILGFISGMIVQHNLQIKKNHETQKTNYEYGKTPDASLKIFGSAGKTFSKSKMKIRTENPVVEIAYADDSHLYAFGGNEFDVYLYGRHENSNGIEYVREAEEPAIKNCRFIYLFSILKKQHALCQHSKGNGDLYLWAQENSGKWILQNDEKPILRQSMDGPWQKVWNVAVTQVDNRWVFLAETGEAKTYGISYTWSEGKIDPKQLELNKSKNFLIKNAGNPWVHYISKYKQILMLHGFVSRKENGSDEAWSVTASSIRPCFSTNCICKISTFTNRFLITVRDVPISIADPELFETGGGGGQLRLAFSYAQDRVYEYEAPISILNFYELLIKK